MFYQIFLSPQVKRWAIITYTHGIYELPHELPSELRLRRLGNIRKVSKLHRMTAQCPTPHQSGSFVDTSRKLLKTEMKLFLQSAISPEK